MAAPDLITSDYAAAFLLAAGVTPNAGQAAFLPSLITSASEAVRRVCNRNFDRRIYADEYDPGGMGVMLREFPVNAVLRVAGNRSTAISIAADRNTNQRATVAFTTSGDEETGLTFTGLTLTRVATGTTTVEALAFVDYPTISTLSAAINELGGGWTAIVASNFGGWPSTELIGGDVAQGAVVSAAELWIYASDLAGCRLIDRRTGLIEIPTFRHLVQVTYDAGFDTIPAAVQEGTAEVLKFALDRIPADAALSGEVLKGYQWTARDIQTNIPPAAWYNLMRFKNWKC